MKYPRFSLDKILRICYHLSMKALSIYAPFATAIAANLKTIETRSWSTDYRGEILICSTVKDKNYKPIKDYFIFGKALAIAAIKDCTKFKKTDYEKAMVDPSVDMTDMYSWHLTDIKPIKPIDIKGQQRIYNTKIDRQDLEILTVQSEDELLNYWYKNKLINKLPDED